MKRILITGLLTSTVSLLAHSQTCLSSAPETSPEANFVQVTTGEVLDSTTNLVWQRCALGQTFSGGTCTGEASQFTWQEALAAAQTANDTDTKGWRLPNLKELASLTERQCVRPAINATAFPATPSDDFWTSTPSTADAERAWVVAFFNSSHSLKDKNRFVFVRLVRTYTEG